MSITSAEIDVVVVLIVTRRAVTVVVGVMVAWTVMAVVDANFKLVVPTFFLETVSYTVVQTSSVA